MISLVVIRRSPMMHLYIDLFLFSSCTLHRQMEQSKQNTLTNASRIRENFATFECSAHKMCMVAKLLLSLCYRLAHYFQHFWSIRIWKHWNQLQSNSDNVCAHTTSSMDFVNTKHLWVTVGDMLQYTNDGSDHMELLRAEGSSCQVYEDHQCHSHVIQPVNHGWTGFSFVNIVPSFSLFVWLNIRLRLYSVTEFIV